MQIINKYPKSCSVCKKPVGVGEGFAANGSGKWQTFCRAHAPEQIVARQAQSTVRALHANGFVDLPYDPSNVGIIKSAPGATWHKQDCNCGCGGCKKWSVSLAHQDRLRVLEIADRLQLQVAPVLRTLCDADHASLADVDLPAGKSLYPFQKEGIAWLSRRDRAVLGDEMGLGKTVQILLALGKEDRVIVVCPNSLKLNWRDEANLWRPEFKVRVVKAEDKKTGGFPIPKKGEIVVVNYDILPSWLDFDPRKPETAALPKGVEVLKGITVVVDERTSSPTTRRSGAGRSPTSPTWSAGCGLRPVPASPPTPAICGVSCRLPASLARRSEAGPVSSGCSVLVTASGVGWCGVTKVRSIRPSRSVSAGCRFAGSAPMCCPSCPRRPTSRFP